MEQVRDGNRDDTPDTLRQSDLAKAFFGELKGQLANTPTRTRAVHKGQAGYGGADTESAVAAKFADLLAEAALEIEAIIRRHAIIRWRDNADAQNRMRNDLDDLLFDLQREKGVAISLPQMDAIIEAILRIARNRQDV